MSRSALTVAQARRIAIAAQGFTDTSATAVTRAHLRKLISRIQVLQLDSVSVAVRAHYAPVFSRLGPYDRRLLDDAAWSHSARTPRLLIEYWAHEAALMSIQDWPLMRWRMREYRHGRWARKFVEENPGLVDEVLAAVAELGPCTAGQIEAYLEREAPGRKGPWWDRSETKWIAEALFSSGELTTDKRVGFSRHYQLAHKVIPADIYQREVSDEEAVLELARRAVGALGVGTEADIRDYFRLSAGQIKPALAALADAGEVERVAVDGWGVPAYLAAGRTIPRADRGTALLCPFDPLIFFRPRVERLFDFHYRIEIYTPADKRQYGYYVWPFLLDGQLVGRVDLKADRAAGTLNVVGAFAEEGRDPVGIAGPLAEQLVSMASWLGLERVAVGERGDLVRPLGAVLRTTR